jgi:FtsP/CotA-like multicopper oxidase with cupredoxin domain
VPVRPGNVEFARKDVLQLGFGEQVEILIRFRDFRGGYPIHCHNTVHEDHQMMMLFNVADVGDNNTRP